MTKETIGRTNQTRNGDPIGPGAYEVQKEFGKDVKGLGFGKPKPEKREVDNRDYSYSAEQEFTQTRHRSPSATISKTGARPDSFANSGEIAGPGQYQVEKEFGSDAKGLGFGKPKPGQRDVDNRDYDNSPEREFA